MASPQSDRYDLTKNSLLSKLIPAFLHDPANSSKSGSRPSSSICHHLDSQHHWPGKILLLRFLGLTLPNCFCPKGGVAHPRVSAYANSTKNASFGPLLLLFFFGEDWGETWRNFSWRTTLCWYNVVNVNEGLFLIQKNSPKRELTSKRQHRMIITSTSKNGSYLLH